MDTTHGSYNPADLPKRGHPTRDSIKHPSLVGERDPISLSHSEAPFLSPSSSPSSFPLILYTWSINWLKHQRIDPGHHTQIWLFCKSLETPTAQINPSFTRIGAPHQTRRHKPEPWWAILITGALFESWTQDPCPLDRAMMGTTLQSHVDKEQWLWALYRTQKHPFPSRGAFSRTKPFRPCPKQMIPLTSLSMSSHYKPILMSPWLLTSDVKRTRKCHRNYQTTFN